MCLLYATKGNAFWEERKDEKYEFVDIEYYTFEISQN